MTWAEALECACPAMPAGALEAMGDAARAALEGGRPLFEATVAAFPGDEGARVGLALACLGVGLDLHASSLAQGVSGGSALLLGDGLLTRAMELAAPGGPAAAEAMARCAAAALAEKTPSAALARMLGKDGIGAFFAPTPVIPDGGSP